MSHFKIEFSLKDIDYTAHVQRVEAAGGIHLARYHVTAVFPAIPGIPDPYNFVYEFYGSQFAFPPFNESNDLPETILSAIEGYCTKHKIAFEFRMDN
jgi:hypothetical protein